MSIQFQFATNPQTATKKPSEEKIAELKEQQESKRNELLGFVKDYTASYEASKKDYAQAQSIFLMQQQELKKHDESDRDYEKYEKEYKQAKKAFQGARFDKDLKLQLLQYRSDNYNKACRINLIDLA